MDKFRKLEIELENLIKRLDHEIKDKNNLLSEINEDVEQTRELINSTKIILESAEAKRDTLSTIKDQNIIFYCISCFFKNLKDEAKEIIKKYTGFSLFLARVGFSLFSLLITLIIGYSVLTNPTMTLGVAILYGSFALALDFRKILNLRRLKKNFTLGDLEEIIKEAKESITLNEKDIIESKTEAKAILNEIQKLQVEKSNQEKTLKSVKDTRENAINLLTVSILDEAYDSRNMDKIAMRVKKKEGTNNG